jgi:Flp pilus assembly protein TadD
MPDLVEARLNLGMALANEGNYSEALPHFEEVRQRDPTNTLALGYVQALRDTPYPTQSADS